MSESVPNQRFEGVVSKIAEIINDEHSWDCIHETRESYCTDDRARAALEYLRDSGLLRKGYFAPLLGTTELGLVARLREMCDDTRAHIAYDQARGIVVHDSHLWRCLGWDVGLLGTHLRHPSEAVAMLFNVPVWRPTQDELTWFRDGFVHQRKGSSRPAIKG